MDTPTNPPPVKLPFIREKNSTLPKEDVVNNPSHYTAGPVETIDFIQEVLTNEEFVGWLKGNWLKYKDRAEQKNGAEDHAKAQFYKEYLMHAGRPCQYEDPRSKRKGA
jgi:hypothetical protein